MTDNGFRLFRSKTTGKTGLYPEHFASWPDFDEIDSETGELVAEDAPTTEVTGPVMDSPAPLEKRK